MASKKIHRKWGLIFEIPEDTVDCMYSLINSPNMHIGYLQYLTKVTEWWDDNDKDYILNGIKKNCKTPADRIKAEQEYNEYLSDHLRGVKPSERAKFTKFQGIFFGGRTTGRDLSRVKDIGYFQSYMQQKYIRPQGRECLYAWYLHHLIDYCGEVNDLFELTEIINKNRKRIKLIYPEYEEVVSFIQQHWEDIKKDLSGTGCIKS